jgi:hypothetical protein
MAMRFRRRNRTPRVIDSPAAALRTLLQRPPEQAITVGDIVHVLGGRGFGVLLFVWAVLSLIPAFVPGMSTILGLPLVFLSWQLAWGVPEPWIPKRLAARAIAREYVEKLAEQAAKFRPFERMLRPRLTLLVIGPGQRLLGVVALVLSIVFVLPVPFGNWLPGTAIAVIALAVARRDGVAAIVGLALAAAAGGLVYALGFAGVAAFKNIFG